MARKVGQRARDEEDLDEDWRVADHLDVDRRDPADDGDAMGAGRTEQDPDRERAGDADPRDLQRLFEPVPEVRDVLPDEVPVEACEQRHRAMRRGAAASATAPTPLRHGQIAVTSLPTGNSNVFFGRGTLSMKSGTSRAGAFARRILTNSSRFFM